jgi:hypothetical protein
MIELLAWIGLAFSFALMIYHYYMYSNYNQVYGYIKKKFDDRTDDTEFPSKEDHSKNYTKYSYYTAGLATILIIINYYFK